MAVSVVLNIVAILAILVGILILAFPKLLRWAIGLYLIILGTLQLISNYVQFSPI